MFYTAAASFYIPTSSAQEQGLPFLHMLTNTYYFPFFKKIIAVLMSVKWYLIVIFNLISLMATDVEHLLIRTLLAICISSLKKCLFKSSAHF